MDHETLYQAIFHRCSVRKYDAAPLPKQTLEELRSFMSGLLPLLPEIKTELKLLGPDSIKINAPHAVCLYSEKKDGWRMNAGFLMEQILSLIHI